MTLFLRHRFKQRALHFRRRAIDFVGKDDIGKDGAFLWNKLTRLLAINHRADQIAGEQVRGELDALELSVENTRQSFDGQGFARPESLREAHVRR